VQRQYCKSSTPHELSTTNDHEMEICSDPLRLNKARSFGRTRQRRSTNEGMSLHTPGQERVEMQGIEARASTASSTGLRLTSARSTESETQRPAAKSCGWRVLRASNGVVQRGLRRVGLWR
jgi:hypothetical protein